MEYGKYMEYGEYIEHGGGGQMGGERGGGVFKEGSGEGQEDKEGRE
jgi:hypothetical protein